jgi:hypothetical protein
MIEAEIAPGRNVKVGQKSIRMKIKDIIYVLDIQNKNRKIPEVLAAYGLDMDQVEVLKGVLESGTWDVKQA